MSQKTIRVGVGAIEGQFRSSEGGDLVGADGRFDFVFSSDAKIPRRDLITGEAFYEILDHSSPDSMDRRGIDNGVITVNVNHERMDTVAVVERAEILPSHGMGVGTARFDTDSRATEVRGKVARKQWRGISAEYMPGHYVDEGTHKGLPLRRNLGWQLRGVAIQPGQADITNHILATRADDEYRDVLVEKRSMSDDNKSSDQKISGGEPTKPIMSGHTPTTAELLETIDKLKRANEEERARDIVNAAAIRAMAAKTGNEDIIKMGEQDIQARVDKGEFAEKVAGFLMDRGSAKPDNPFKDSHSGKPTNDPIGMEKKEVKSWSMLRAIEAQFTQGDKPFRESAPLEWEASMEVQKRNNLDEPKGFYVPEDVQTDWFGHSPNMHLRWNEFVQHRVAPMKKITAGEGAELVGVEHMGFIEFLYANSVLATAGATTLSGLVQDVQIPRQEGSSPAVWQNPEGAAGTAQVIPTGQLTLVNRTIMTHVSWTRRLSQQSSPGVEQMARNDVAIALALGMDLAGLEGDGTGGSPVGITNTSGVAAQSVAAAGNPTWAEALGFWSQVANNNAAQGALAFITSPATVASMMNREQNASVGTGGFVAQASSATEGALSIGGVWRLLQTTQMASANTIIFGNFQDLIMARWGALDINVNRDLFGFEGDTVLHAFLDGDIGVRRAASFIKDGP